jgi:hypothetical protein
MVKNTDKRKEWKIKITSGVLIFFNVTYVFMLLLVFYPLFGIKDIFVFFTVFILLMLVGPMMLTILGRMNGAIMKLQEEVESLTEQLGSSDSSED